MKPAIIHHLELAGTIITFLIGGALFALSILAVLS